MVSSHNLSANFQPGPPASKLQGLRWQGALKNRVPYSSTPPDGGMFLARKLGLGRFCARRRWRRFRGLSSTLPIVKVGSPRLPLGGPAPPSPPPPTPATNMGNQSSLPLHASSILKDQVHRSSVSMTDFILVCLEPPYTKSRTSTESKTKTKTKKQETPSLF